MHRQGNASMRLGSRLSSILFACLVAWGPSVASAEDEMTAECRAFRADIDANIGDIMRAGCEPTLGQMSKLMDNPIGNVAMWINQNDLFSQTLKISFRIAHRFRFISNRASGGCLEKGQNIQQSGLAGPVRALQSVNFTFSERQGRNIQNGAITEFFGQI